MKPVIEVQSVRFSKDFFKDYETCLKWLANRGYSKAIFRDLDSFYVFDQLDASRFIDMSLQPYKIDAGIESLVGILKADQSTSLENVMDAGVATTEATTDDVTPKFDALKAKVESAVSKLSEVLSDLTKSEAVAKTTPVESLVVKSETECDFDMFVPIFKGKDERTVFGEVLIPNDEDAGLDPDAQGEIYSEEDVQKAAYSWIRDGGGDVGLMHKKIISDQVSLLETYVAPVGFTLTTSAGDERPIKKGTWLLKLFIEDDDLWDRVKAGEIQGFSIGGTATAQDIQQEA